MKTDRGSRTWGDTDAFLSCTGKGISFHGGEVCLRRGVTVADEMGCCNNRDKERIAGLRQARKILVLGPVRAQRAVLGPYLNCDRPGSELDILVNGHQIRIAWREKRQYWEDRWTPVEIPLEQLKPGENDVVFRAVDAAEWSLLLENGRWPDRSLVSEDGGQTWRSEDLGQNNRGDGEYVVRLWLDQHAEFGGLESDPVDTLLLGSNGEIASLGRVKAIQFDTDVETPDGTGVSLLWRGGPTPAYDPTSWTAWQPTQGDVEPKEGVRYVQWRMALETEDPDRTPVVRRVTVSADTEVARAATARVVEADNPALVRSSYRFAYLPADEKRAKILRERWKLDEVVRGARSEFEAIQYLRQWVRSQWEDGWNMGEIDLCPPWDAMVILELASRKLSLGMCTHYATVTSQCCAALGFVARTQIMHGHCINEVWSGEHGKWVAMDAGGDTNDETQYTYHFERNGVPLSALEVHRAWVDEDYGDVVLAPAPPPALGESFTVAKRLQLFERFMIALRNDELATMGPGETEHGKGSYHYDGYLFWQDEKTEPLPWFSKHTDRPGDLYWTVNRAVIHLQQGDELDGLQVLLETETPNLDGFEMRFDGGGWQRGEVGFHWPLKKDESLLEVRPVNGFGRKGAVSWVKVKRKG